MNFEIICSRGANAYLVRRGDKYCMVNLATGKYNESDDPGVFLKLGYFEDVENVEQSVMECIAGILANPDNCATAI